MISLSNIRLAVPLLFTSALILLLQACNKDENALNGSGDILVELQSIDGLTIKEIPVEDHFERLFEIRIDQPVDHNQPNGLTFSQKLYLGHIASDLPMVFETEGYERSNHKTREISELLNTNQLTVEHRFFGESKPEPLDWNYLNIWQAASDHHRIVELFKNIYSSSWISSGVSKGGDAAIFHRRFFPEDVVATVAYVAPILFEQQDQRFLTYFDQVGSELCREKLATYQRNMLLNIDSFTPLFEQYIADVNSKYNTDFTFSLPFKDIVYHSIREDYLFEFWSSESENCLTIPNADATLEQLFDHFVSVFNIFLFFSDYGVDFWTPWLYQSKTEMGNYAFDVGHLQDLTQDLEPLVSFSASTDFDPSIMIDIDNWVNSNNSNIIFIYGEEDPWTVAAFDPPPSENVFRIINPGTKHQTRISDLSSSNQSLVLEKINSWLGL